MSENFVFFPSFGDFFPTFTFNNPPAPFPFPKRNFAPKIKKRKIRIKVQNCSNSFVQIELSVYFASTMVVPVREIHRLFIVVSRGFWVVMTINLSTTSLVLKLKKFCCSQLQRKMNPFILIPSWISIFWYLPWL